MFGSTTFSRRSSKAITSSYGNLVSSSQNPWNADRKNRTVAFASGSGGQSDMADLALQALRQKNSNASAKRWKFFPRCKAERSLFCLYPKNPIRKFCMFIVDSQPFEFLILLTIFSNCIVLAMNTPYPANDANYLEKYLERIEQAFIVIFTMECILKIIAYGFMLHPGSYLRNVWNGLDFFIVFFGILTLILSYTHSTRVDVKALRAFRVLRPLRLVSGLPSLQVVLNSIIMALVPLFHIFLLVLFVIIVYAIVGLELFSGKLHKTCYTNTTGEIMLNPRPCGNDSSGFHCSKLDNKEMNLFYVCRDLHQSGKRWAGPNDGITNFDNIGLAMLTVFQCVTMEGWIDNLYAVNDSVGRTYPWIFFVSLILLGSFFVLNLILGVLSGEFGKEKDKIDRKEQFHKQRLLKKEEKDYEGYKEWIDAAEEISDDEDDPRYMQIRTSKRNSSIGENTSHANHLDSGNLEAADSPAHMHLRRLKLCPGYKRFRRLKKRVRRVTLAFIKSREFFIIIIILVFLNTCVLTTEHYHQPRWLDTFQDNANMVFVILFTLEMFIKVFSLGWSDYIMKIFNRFDLLVVICSVLELIFLQTNLGIPIGLSVFRCARLLRIFKLTKHWAGLRSLVEKLLKSMKSIASLLLLMFLFIVIFALLGMQLFGGKFNFENETRPRSNFDGFWPALLTVFQILTGEDWNSVMYNGIKAYNGVNNPGVLLCLYFIILIIIGNYILLNVFLAIAVDNLNSDEDEEQEQGPTGAVSSPNLTFNNNNQSNNDKSTGMSSNHVPSSHYHRDTENFSSKHSVSVRNESDFINSPPMDDRSDHFTYSWSDHPVNYQDEDESVYKQLHPASSHRKYDHHTYEEMNRQLESQPYDVVFAENENDASDNESDGVRKSRRDSETGLNLLSMGETPAELRVIPQHTAFYIFSTTNKFRVFCHNIVCHPLFGNLVLFCILLSSAMLAAEDPIYINSPRNKILNYFDYFFTSIFTIEITLKMIAYGFLLHEGAFLRSMFNWVDLIVVFVALVSFVFDNETISVVKILRVLRVLRPLRAINRAKGLKNVVQCVIVAIKSIWNIMLVTFLLEFMFAVIGVQLFKGKLQNCNDLSRKTEKECQGYFIDYYKADISRPYVEKRTWGNNPLNYDNVPNALLALFTVSTFEGWPKLLYKSIDAHEEDKAGIINNHLYMAIFYVVYIVVIAFFMINIFVGFVIVTFQKEGEREYKNCALNKNQRKCIEFALKARPVPRYIPKGHIQYKIWAIVCSKKFEYLILVFILINTIFLALKYDTQSKQYEETLDHMNVFFTAVFTVEFILKLSAFSFRSYFREFWNIYDAIIVFGSYLDIVLSRVLAKDSRFISVNFFRLFRVMRVVKLLSKEDSIRKLLWTFIKSLQALPYVALLIVMLFFIYAVIGMQMFGKISTKSPEGIINENNNFRTFFQALLVLFRSSTGESWQDIMLASVGNVTCDEPDFDGNSSLALEYMEANTFCGHDIAYPYFISFYIICSFLIINLFVAVIMDNFDYLTRDWSILGPHHLDEFISKWSEYDPEAKGRVRHLEVVSMLGKINPPLGFGSMCPHTRACHKLVRMNMPLQSDGTVLFNATLFALVRRNLKIKIPGQFNADHNKSMDELNEELRAIIKSVWKRTSSKLLDQILPPKADARSGSDVVTVGKFYATFLIQNWFREWKKRRVMSQDCRYIPNIIAGERKIPHQPTICGLPRKLSSELVADEKTLRGIVKRDGNILERTWSSFRRRSQRKSHPTTTNSSTSNGTDSKEESRTTGNGDLPTVHIHIDADTDDVQDARLLPESGQPNPANLNVESSNNSDPLQRRRSRGGSRKSLKLCLGRNDSLENDDASPLRSANSFITATSGSMNFFPNTMQRRPSYTADDIAVAKEFLHAARLESLKSSEALLKQRKTSEPIQERHYPLPLRACTRGSSLRDGRTLSGHHLADPWNSDKASLIKRNKLSVGDLHRSASTNSNSSQMSRSLGWRSPLLTSTEVMHFAELDQDENKDHQNS